MFLLSLPAHLVAEEQRELREDVGDEGRRDPQQLAKDADHRRQLVVVGAPHALLLQQAQQLLQEALLILEDLQE